MSAQRQGFGLVKRARLEIKPLVIEVGNGITVTLTRLGTATATVAVKAPPDMTIQFNEGHSMHETVEQAIKSVLQGDH